MAGAATAGAARHGLALMLRVNVARKAFAARAVLSEIEFEIGAREIIAITGASGCGKTTLLRLIAGLDTDFEGSIAWPTATPPRIGMAFQEPRLLPWCTVRENLTLVMPSGLPTPAMTGLITALGLGAEQDRPAARLSLGMARRLALARAFVVEPQLILLDEPFASLDEANIAQARALLLDIWSERPAAIVLITHDLMDAAFLADRILVLSGSPATITTSFSIPESQRRAGGDAAAETVAALRQIIRPG